MDVVVDGKWGVGLYRDLEVPGCGVAECRAVPGSGNTRLWGGGVSGCTGIWKYQAVGWRGVGLYRDLEVPGCGVAGCRADRDLEVPGCGVPGCRAVPGSGNTRLWGAGVSG